MGLTITEKILAKACGKTVTPGEIVFAKPDVVASDEGSFGGCMEINLRDELKKIGVTKVNFDPNKIVLSNDHRVPSNDLLSAERHINLRKFAMEQGIKHFYDIGRGGINHQADAERGHARPGILYVAREALCATLGSLGCLAVGVPNLLEIFALGKFWMKVPESQRFEITGKLRKGVMSRDLIQQIIGDLGVGGAANTVMEFAGPGVESMSIDYRMILCNQTSNAGAVTGIVNPDQKTIDYVTPRVKEPFEVLRSDPDAEYAEQFHYDASKQEPMVTAPPDPRNTKTISEVDGIEIDQGFIGSCAGGRPDELKVVAKILKNRKISPETRLIIIPPTVETYMTALRQRWIETFVQAGAVVCNPNCGPCAGAQMGILGDEEVCVSTQTLNIPGRSGSRTAEIYLASPATVAASAVAGQITDPRKYF